jgi:hypothetical protein
VTGSGCLSSIVRPQLQMFMSKRAWIIVVPIAIMLALLAALQVSGRRESQEIRPWISCTRLLYLASHGCSEFKEHHGAWPSSLPELCASRGDLVEAAKDTWGHDVVYIPHNDALGYGEIISYGRDGKPGGTGADSDLVIRFPLKANAAWNKQQAIGLRLPRQLQSWTNWYEDYNE